MLQCTIHNAQFTIIVEILTGFLKFNLLMKKFCKKSEKRKVNVQKVNVQKVNVQILYLET